MKTFILALSLLFVSSAHASYLQDAANAYREGTLVYQTAKAELRISDADVAAISSRIRGGEFPIFIAILPADSQYEGAADMLPGKLAAMLPVPVAVAVVAGRSFRVTAREDIMGVQPSAVAGLATSALQAKKPNLTDILSEWIFRLNSSYVLARPDIKPVPPELESVTPVTKSEGWSLGTWLSILFIVCVVAYGVYWLYLVFRETAINRETDRMNAKRWTEYNDRQTSKDMYATRVVGDRMVNYATNPMGECTHYFTGGRYQGRQLDPGYYSAPFWDYIVLDSVLHDRGYRDDRLDPAPPSDRAVRGVETPVGGGDLPSPAPVSADPPPAPSHVGGGDLDLPDVPSFTGGGDFFGGGGTDGGGGDVGGGDL